MPRPPALRGDSPNALQPQGIDLDCMPCHGGAGSAQVQHLCCRAPPTHTTRGTAHCGMYGTSRCRRMPAGVLVVTSELARRGEGSLRDAHLRGTAPSAV